MTLALSAQTHEDNVTIYDLDCGKSFKFQVAGYNNVGIGEYSSNVSANTSKQGL